MKIKTIDILAKEWFDKKAGNSYFSAQITINLGLKSEQRIYIPFQYGYGDSYYNQSLKELSALKLLPVSLNYPSEFREYFEENKIIVRTNILEKCLKRDVIAFGTDPETINSNPLYK